jgi:hypothetical protein
MQRLAAALALALALTPAVALADGGTEHPEGAYNGAKPGVRPGSETGRPQKPPPHGTLSWIGFEAKDAGATVWLQAAGPFEIAQHVEGSTLVIAVTGLTRMARNTGRIIDTRYFDNPLARIDANRVRARRHKQGGIEIRIQFKNPKDAKEAAVRSATEADGLYYTYLSFPPGTDLPPVDDTAPAATPADVER